MRAVLGLTLGGIPGVLVAAFVFSKFVTLLSSRAWLVVVVVVYAGIVMLRSATRRSREETEYAYGNEP